MIEGELAEVKKSLIELSDKLSGMISDQISANISDTISDSIAMKVDMGQPSPPSPALTATTATPSPTKKTLVGYPFGITEDNWAYYNKLVGKPELLKIVNKLLNSGISNQDLPPLLIEHGFTKRDGSAIDDGRLSHIKSAVKVLNEVEANDN